MDKNDFYNFKKKKKTLSKMRFIYNKCFIQLPGKKKDKTRRNAQVKKSTLQDFHVLLCAPQMLFQLFIGRLLFFNPHWTKLFFFPTLVTFLRKNVHNSRS